MDTAVAIDDWTFINKKSGVSVYKRDYPNSQFKEFRGVVQAEASLSAFVALLMDTPNMASWMHKTDEVRVLDQLADNERIAYMLFDFAPIGKRELVVRNRVQQCPDTLAVHYSMDFQDTHQELDRTPHRGLENLRGYVEAKPVGKGVIEITYQAHVEPGIELLKLWGASAVTNKLLSDTPYYTLKNARKLINHSRYAGKSFDFIQD